LFANINGFFNPIYNNGSININIKTLVVILSPVLYFEFNNNVINGGSFATIISGSGTPAFASDALTCTSKFQMSIPTNSNDGYSFAAYFTLSRQCIFMEFKNETTTNTPRIMVYWLGPSFGNKFAIHDGTYYNGPVLMAGTYHIVVTYTKTGTVKVFVNGGSPTTYTGLTQDISFTRIGFWQSYYSTTVFDSTTKLSGCNMKKFAYYDKTLSDSDAAAIYQNGGGLYQIIE
jgi:hypothetical protein